MVYNEKEKISETVLSKAPNCIALSENGQQLFIGHSELISCIDSATLQVSKTFDLDFSVFDLAYGENGWLYISPDADYTSEPILYLNITSGKLLRKKAPIFTGGRTHFKKIKGLPVLLCTRKFITPSGAILLDIANEIPGEEKYWHQSLGGAFWFSENHKYFYDSYGKIFATPTFNTGQDLLPVGELASYMNANCVDHCAHSNSIWVALNYYDSKHNIARYHAGDYHLLESFQLSKYATTINSTLSYYNTIPHYIFSSQSGTYIYIIKNVFVSHFDNPNAWSMEILTFN